MPEQKHEAIKDRLELIASWLHEKKAKDIVAFDLKGVTSFTEGMVIATANSARQTKALCDWILIQGKERGEAALGVEGKDGGQWILVDFNDVVVHIFQKDVRELYNIEGLFTGVTRIDLGFREKKDDSK
ncbi:MAG: ribosome silencing factor [Desulfoplanes sp.]|nr:ribosome silencing factor [Desulfoplanes sp.]MDD4649089.1 ribosome silencing factor [Desulfoplanes sp.]